jgi:hypothetical protein
VSAGTDPPSQGNGRGDKADLAVLVLDVELDRVQAERRGVLLELAGNRRERHRHVDAADLLRDRRACPLRRGGGLPLRRRRLGGSLVTAFRERSRADRDGGGGEEQRGRADRPAQPSTPPRLCSSLPKTVVRVEIRLHRTRNRTTTSPIWRD